MTLSSSLPVFHPQVASRLVDGEAVIILPQSGQIVVLNEVGSRIWDLADGRHSVGQIAEAIAAEYEVTAEQAIRDVEGFVRQLVEKEMLVLAGAACGVGNG